MNYTLDIIMLPVQWIVIFFTTYYIVLAIFGSWHVKEKKSSRRKQIRYRHSGAQ